MEIYIIYKYDERSRSKQMIYSSPNYEEAKRIQDHINNQIIERLGICYDSISAKLEVLPFGSYKDFLTKDDHIRKLIEERLKEVEQLRNNLRNISN